MRIALINDTVYPYMKGGGQKRVYEIARRLVRRGHDVHWYGMDYGHKEIEGIKLHAVSPEYKLYNANGRRRISQAVRFSMNLDINENFDLIDCMSFPYLHCFVAKDIAWRMGIPLAITWFEYWGNYWYEYIGKLGFFGKTIERMVTRLPKVIIADSDKVKRLLMGVKVDGKKIRVIPDGVDVELIKSVEPSKEKFDVLYVGRVLPHKNVDLLIKAMHKIDGTLGIVGTGDSLEKCKLLATYGLNGKVKFLGHVEKDTEVYSLMKSAKVLVIPSVQEGHPLVIPESNAAGIPVIGIKGVCDEFIHHGVTGYLANPDEHSLAVWINLALSIYPKYKDKCIEDAEHYDWEVITSKVESVYREMI